MTIFESNTLSIAAPSSFTPVLPASGDVSSIVAPGSSSVPTVGATPSSGTGTIVPPTSSVVPPGGSSGGIVKPGGGSSSVNGVKPLAFAQDRYGNCENYSLVIGAFKSCSQQQIDDYYEQQRLRRELEAGNDKDGKNSLRYAELLFGEIEQVARTRFGAFGGSENVQYVRQIREFLFDPQIGMPPSEVLALSLMLRNYVELEQPREMAIRLRAAAGELKNTNAALDRAWKSCRDDARKCGTIPDLRSGTAAVLFAVGIYDDMDITRFTTRMQAFFDDGLWGVIDLATLGLGLGGLLRNAAKNALRGGASTAGRLGGSGVRGQGSAYARAIGCNSFSGNTKVWVAQVAQDVAKTNKPGQTLASRASSAVKGAKAVLTTIAISSVAIGTPVLAFNEVSNQQEIQPVTATISHGKNDQSVVTLKLETSDGKQEVLETTPEHPFAVRVGQDGQIAWVNAIDLTKGQSIARADGKSGRLIARSVEARDVQLYNLTVKTAHTYYVGEQQWLIHNCEIPNLPQYVRGAKTEGYLVINGNTIPLVSGKGPGSNFPDLIRGLDLKGTPVIVDHVEAHAAALMRSTNATEATLTLNHVPCSGPMSCQALLGNMVPSGATLRVIVPPGLDPLAPNGFTMIVTGK